MKVRNSGETPQYAPEEGRRNEVFHLLFAVDVQEDNVRVVTAYRPSSEECEADFKTRRQPL